MAAPDSGRQSARFTMSQTREGFQRQEDPSGEGAETTLARISDGSCRAGRLHAFGLCVHGTLMASSFAGSTNRREPDAPPSPDRSSDGAHRNRDHLLALGKAVG